MSIVISKKIREVMAMKSIQCLFVIVASLTIFYIPVANASDLNLFQLTYPAAICNMSSGVKPNNAAGVGNWTSTNQRVFCPILADEGWVAPNLNAFISQIEVVKEGNVSCTLRRHTRTGGSAVIKPDLTEHHSGFDEIVWEDNVFYNRFEATALECLLKPGSKVHSYRIHKYWYDRH
jgi:hypothetical protein